MAKIVDVRLKASCKIEKFDCGVFVLKLKDKVIVETDDGFIFGTVIRLFNIPESLEDKDYNKEKEQYQPKEKNKLKKIFRIANKDDFEQEKANIKLENKAFDFCQKLAKKLELKMNLFCVESTFNQSKLTFFFTATERVDFRELVKLLVKEFCTRIEMRQVSVRSQAKMCGGLGRCGQKICCSVYLDKCEPVSIKMAKEQNLSLNPSKISGQCGKLMCCLSFEHNIYEKLKENFPEIGKLVKTSRGEYKVIGHNVIANRLMIDANGQQMEINLNEVIESQNLIEIEKENFKKKENE